MDSSDCEHTSVACILQEQLKVLEDSDIRGYHTNGHDGISRSSSLAILVDGADLDNSPISPLSASPSPSTRADDSMSDVLVLSPYTPLLDMSPTTATPQNYPLRELEFPSPLSPTGSTLSRDPFTESPTSQTSPCSGAPAPASKPNFRTKAKGLSFKIPSLNPRPGQGTGLLDIVRQNDVSPLPSPLARDLRRRVEAHPGDDQEIDITTSFEKGSILSAVPDSNILPYEVSCLGLDLGLDTSTGMKSDSSSYFLASPTKRQDTLSIQAEHEHDYGRAGAKIMRASVAHSSSAELVSSPSRSQARQERPMSSLSSVHENLSATSSKKYPRKSVPLPPPHLKSPFAPLSVSEQYHGAYMSGLGTLRPSPSAPDEMVFKRTNHISSLRPSPSIGRFLSSGPLSPSPKRKSAPREAHAQLSASDLLHLQMQGASQFPKYFPEGYLLEAKFARQYCLETELGSGGYGFVLGARNVYTNEQVAVKFINRRLVPTRGLVRDYKNDIVPLEAVVLQLAQHPGVVRFYGLYEDGMYFYLVQELHGSPWSKNAKNKHKSDREAVTSANEAPQVDTAESKLLSPYAPVHSSPLRPLAASNSMPSIPTLRQTSSFSPNEVPLGPRVSLPLLAARPQMPRRASYDLFECIEQHERLSEGQAKYIFAQVVDTVWYLDSIGITHRDIKDENLVIDREFKVKFIDFGSAVIRDVRKPPPAYTTFFGTVTFASPEILKNLPYTAPPAEVWTLGILLSFLVTGQSPFPTTEHAMCAVMCEPQESIVVSPACGDLMRKCLNPDPARRFTIQQVYDHVWLRGALDRA
ncbi:Serine/Threonine kinase catalytic domain protein [Rhizoctonia solani 123E]|uniref:Serine/Threonine kinase catalytic domain protein n=1 Tax=Rhizoctonia solani 123E TaxID=1423351 RepID=A0A074T042_9AGAM|nr:Serine/Threonine kinase catalytic domain protein [Rhizoctonia solani 123E]